MRPSFSSGGLSGPIVRRVEAPEQQRGRREADGARAAGSSSAGTPIQRPALLDEQRQAEAQADQQDVTMTVYSIVNTTAGQNSVFFAIAV